MAGTIELTPEYYEETQNQVMMLDGAPGGFGNHVDGTSGTLRLGRFEPSRGIVDITFEEVILPHWSSGAPCHINGHVETFGLTWGQ